MRRSSAALLLGLALAAVAPVVGADEAAPTASGWWWVVQQAPIGGVAVPPPPTVPPGGLYVASDTSQTQAVSALRYDLPEGAAPRALTLQIADVKGIGEVGACTATSSWKPAEAGSWAERPSFDCAGAAAGAVAADGASIRFDLSGLGSRSSVDVVLVPLRDDTGNSPVLQMAFAPPGPDSLSFEQAAAAESSPVPSGGSPFPDSDVALPPTASAPSFAPPPLPAVAAPGAAPQSALTNPVAAAPRRVGVSPVARRPSVPATDLGFGETTRFRFIAVLLAINLGALAAWSRSATPRMPRFLGIRESPTSGDAPAVGGAPAVAAVPRGLGRYRTARADGERRYL